MATNKKYIFIILFLSANLYSSLFSQVKSEKQAMVLLQKGAEAYSYHKLEDALYHWKKSYSIFKKIGHKLGEANLLSNLGMVYSEMGQKQKAIECYQNSIQIFNKIGNLGGASYVYYRLGLLYLNANSDSTALFYFKKGADIAEDDRKALIHLNIGLTYKKLELYDMALEYCDSSLTIYKQLNDTLGYAYALGSIGYINMAIGQDSSALNNLQKAVNIIESQSHTQDINYYIEKLTLYKWLAESQREKHEYAEAIKHFKESMELAREINDNASVCECLSGIGAVFVYQNNYNSALQYYEKSLALAMDYNLDKWIKTNIELICVALEKQQGYPLLHDRFHEFYDLAKQYNFVDNLLTLLVNHGYTYWKNGDNYNALELYSRALSIAKEILNFKELARAYIHIGLIYRDFGYYKNALDYYNKAQNIIKEHNIQEFKTTLLLDMGACYLSWAEYSQAINCYNKALNNALKHTNKKDIARSYLNLGQYYIAINDNEKGLQLLKKARALFYDIGDYENEFDILISLSSVYEKLKDIHTSLKYYNQLENNISNYSDEKKNFIYQQLGDLYFYLKEYTRAKAYYEKSANVFGLARLMSIEGNYVDALHIYKDIISNADYDKNRGPRQKGYLNYEIFFEMANCYANLDSLLEAIDYYSKSISINENVRSNINIGHERDKFLSKGLQAYSRIINLMYELNEKDNKINAPYDSLGKTWWDVSYHFCEKCKSRSFVDMIANTKYNQLSSVLPKEIIDEELHLSTQLQHLQSVLEGQIQVTDSELPANLWEQKSYLQSRLDSLSNYIKQLYPDFFNLRYPQPIKANEILLNENEILVEYHVSEDAVFIYIIKNKKVSNVSKIHINRDKLEQKIKKFRLPFESIDKLNSFNPHEAHELYSLLIAPIGDELDPNKHIVIVPDGPLYLLPFEALVVEEKDSSKTTNHEPGDPSQSAVSYLIDKYDISYYQSATVMNIIRIAKKNKQRWEKSILAFGDPIFDSKDIRWAKLSDKTHQNISDKDDHSSTFNLEKRRALENYGYSFNRLVETQDEVVTIGKLYDDSKIFIGMNATEKNIKELDMTPYRYIHFATHGILASEISYLQQPALVFSQIDIKDEDGFLTMEEVLSLKLNADLVTLSACKTGLGEQVKGEGIVGLSRAFMYAGAPSVLVSLWSVSDKSTAELMKRFYSYLKAGKNKSEALTLAKNDLRNGALSNSINRGFRLSEKAVKVKCSHPYFWAPFVLIGEWE